jgi:hypothetical protein
MEDKPVGKKSSCFTFTTTQINEFESEDMRSGWRLIPKESLPSVLPPEFRKKIDSAVMIAAPTSTGGTYLVYNNLRVEQKARAVDQEPFALIVHSTGPSPNGVLIHHGKWEERTITDIPKEFWDHVSESGVGNYYYAHPPAGLSCGTLDKLPEGHRKAFDRIVARIRTGLKNE